jgi:site-specific DNA recombinase
MIHYYRCLGSDAWRHLGGTVCDSKPVRQDLLDELIWREVVKLLESPQLIQEELERRLTAARLASPAKRREDTLQRELARVQKSADRLMTAYQEDLLSLDDLRRRMPELRKREQAIGGELSAIQNQLADRAGYLRLAETITSFLARLHATAKTLDVSERQRIVRLLVKEILVSNDAIVIRHSIPAPTGSPDGGGPTSPPGGGRPSVGDPNYLLRTGSNNPALWRASLPRDDTPIRHLYGCLQPSFDVQKHPRAIRVFADRTHQQIGIDAIEKALDIQIQNPRVTPASLPCHADRVERRFAGSISIGVLVKEGLHERLKLSLDNRLGNSVGDGGNPQRPRPSSPISLRYLNPSHRRRMITARRKSIPELVEVVR